MESMNLRGVRLRTENLSPETRAYVDRKIRSQRRRDKQNGFFNRTLNALLPADYAKVEVESRVSGKVLVVGCSGGIETLGLNAVGMDVDKPALKIAMDLRSRAVEARAEFMAASGGDLPFRDGTFDGVLSDNVVEHLPGDLLPRHFRESARVLKPGGQYVFTTPNRLFEVPAKDGHISLHSYAEWEEMALAAGFGRLRTPRRRSGELGDLEWKKAEEKRAAERRGRRGLSHKGLRMVTLVAFR